MTRVDLERLDEGFDDLAGWADPLPDDPERRARARDEALARATLYPRARLIDVAPVHPPVREDHP